MTNALRTATSSRRTGRIVLLTVLLIAAGPFVSTAQDSVPGGGGLGDGQNQDIGVSSEASEDTGADAGDGTSNLWVWWGWIRGAIRVSLEGLHSVLGSWPAAIIALAVLVRALFLPLTAYSTTHQMSVNQTMARLKPEIEALKKQHRDNPEERDEAILALQKKHGVSPLSQAQGCVPLMIQIPILIALFQVLLSLDPIQGVSFLWIDDLTQPDSLFRWGVELPWLGDSFNLLPVLMLGTHLAIARAASEHGLNKSMLAMPLLIAVLFYPFPSGAILYWLTGSCIQIGETVVIRRRFRARAGG